MKIAKLAAIAALIAVSTSASAWWGGGPWGGDGWGTDYNRGYGRGHGWGNTTGDFLGDAAGAGDFSMNMSGRGNTNMRGYGSGYGAGDGWGRGYNYSAPYYGGYAPYGYAPYGYAPPPAPAPDGAPVVDSSPHRWRSALQWMVRPPCFGGLVGAVVFFALAMTPSLIPRSWGVQGFLAGLTAAIGYGVGSAASAIGPSTQPSMTSRPSATGTASG